MRLNNKILFPEVIFRDGELEYSSFEGGYFDPEGGTMYYLTDWQGNNAAGRNTYDFSARCLTPYGNWNVPDQKAEKYYPISPYTYCAGDPINYIDPDGRWTVYLCDDSNLNSNAYKYPKDTKINVFAHGNPTEIAYTKKSKDATIKTGLELKEAIIVSS